MQEFAARRMGGVLPVLCVHVSADLMADTLPADALAAQQGAGCGCSFPLLFLSGCAARARRVAGMYYAAPGRRLAYACQVRKRSTAAIPQHNM